MDDFGVLVKSYGIKPQGKSAPMASSKSATRTHNHKSVSIDPSFGTKPFSNSTHSSNFGEFGFNSSNMPKNYASSDVFDDVFQSPTKNSTVASVSGGGGIDFDIESMFKGSMKLNSNSLDVNDDLIWGFSGKGSTNVAVETHDFLSSDPVDDFFGKLGNLGSDQRGSKGMGKGKKFDTDDLIPGFGMSNATNARAQAGSREKSAASSLEEFEDFVTGKTKKTAKGHLNGFSVKKESKTVSQTQEANFIDIDGSLNGDSGVHGSKVEVASETLFPEEATDLDSFFSAHSKKTVPDSSVHRTKVEFVSEPMFPEEATDLDSFFSAHSKKSVPLTKDTFMNGKTNEIPDLFSEMPFKMEKKVLSREFADDYSSLFGGAPTSEVFEEIEGESKERRSARFRRHQRAKARMEEALAAKNQRDYEAQQEQEERHRIADAMDMEMKRWAAGKEGNLRALLSSLQLVLAPELGWRPVTLTDLITSSQVKIAYKKAALCVHPDKVQQKGASLQQKFVAEKVFDLLKEAWNKFNSEELR